jgi:hypothetical protein
MSAEGFSIQVGRRYQSTNTQGYSCIPSHVGTDRVTFDKFDSNGKKWGVDDMLHQSFRACYAPIAPDLLKEAVELLRSLVDNCAEYEAWQRPCLAYDNAKAFLASLEVK